MQAEALLKSNLSLPLFKRGKVRDIFDLGDRLLIVSTDRISAFDVVLPNGIPLKGEALNRLSVYWFKETRNIVPNHILDVVDQRTVLVKKAKPIKIEFVVRGYLYGSLWKKYVNGKTPDLPSGLRKAERLPDPILTPTTKAEVGHDIDIEEEEIVKIIGKAMAKKIEEVCLKIYEKASKKAEVNGIIIADTKLEFGFCGDELILIDELLTPDSSRFWPVEKYRVCENQFSFDKQDVRDYLESTRWNKKPPAPTLPEHIILETSKKYIEAYERLTGRKF
ncbi:MAG: phosphoribosylaminoimidazolesuccinocarboxamide synthase [Candidatus Bathyarchaeota archaeon]|jgi:phosphoribosylaminoimidazole-succinocarboxamide synthase|nr:phosphoribosylaminoimidazolesuccinocarboxamide synthase [Candidatus Bathyarchaeota archaeon]